jgi:hypothetical protein
MNLYLINAFFRCESVREFQVFSDIFTFNIIPTTFTHMFYTKKVICLHILHVGLLQVKFDVRYKSLLIDA